MTEKQEILGDSIFLAGLDALALEIIAHRWALVRAFLHDHLHTHSNWHEGLFFPARHQEIQPLFHDLERTVTQVGTQDTTSRQNGRSMWRDEYLLPLAQAFGHHVFIEEQLIHQCWRHGLFDRFVPREGRGPIDYLLPGRETLNRPAFEKILPVVQRVLKNHAFDNQQIQALIEQEMCRNVSAANQIIATLNQINDRAAAAARGVLLGYIDVGLIGLLTNSRHPCADELVFLQRHVASIHSLDDQYGGLLPTLRSDLIALHQTLSAQDPLLWQEHLLHDLPGSPARLRYQKQHLTPHLFTRLIPLLAQSKNCDETEATWLLTTFLDQGLPGLIDGRSAALAQPTQRTFVRLRIQRALDQHLGALRLPARQEIERLLYHLQDAVDETGASFSLVPLLTSHPSSPYRVQRGRRVWYGAAASIKRQQQRRSRYRQRRLGFPSQRHAQSHHEQSTDPGNRLVSAFATRAQITQANARQRLRNLITYGGIGLLPIKEWENAIGHQAQACLYFFKLARVEGTIDWMQMLRQTNAYLQAQNQPGLSRQLATAIFNAQQKPNFWHIGEGERGVVVRKRASLSLRKTPLLHHTWKIVPIQLRFQMINDAHTPISDTCFVLLVIDEGSLLPMGCWVSTCEPHEEEVALALYQAIWHPGALEWPVRGTPEHLLLPASMQIGSLATIERSASFLMTDIGRYTKEKPLRSLKIVQELRNLAPDYIRQVNGNNRVTCRQVQDSLLVWLQHTQLSGLRSAPVPAQCRRNGVTLPLHDGSAAGWLFPVTGTVETSTGEVFLGNAVYTSDDYRLPPGQRLPYRALPYRYDETRRDGKASQGIFVEHNDTLHYLVQRSHRGVRTM